jgi:hypothetical protein
LISIVLALFGINPD